MAVRNIHAWIGAALRRPRAFAGSRTTTDGAMFHAQARRRAPIGGGRLAGATVGPQIIPLYREGLIPMYLPWAKIAGGALVVMVSFVAAVWAMSLFWPGASERRPVLVEVPPLKAAVRTSTIVTPAAIALTAIRDALEKTAPRDLTGQRDNPVSQLLSNAEIGWTVARGPLAVTGKPDALA